jgi:hypothetical protein
MNSSPVTPEDLMPEIVAQLGISAEWARAAAGTPKMGECQEDLCLHYRAMAICVLVSDGDVDGFFQWLLHSPITRRFYLKTTGAPSPAQLQYARASYVDPVLDAVVARQWKLAADIGAATSPDWLEGIEYEDDFCYGDFIRRAVSQDDAGIDALLARWRAALEGGGDARLEIAEALREKNVDVFARSLVAMLEAREAKAMEMTDPEMRSPLASELPFYPNRWVSIDALALLAIGERQGLVVNEELLACPRLVRAGRYAPFRSLGYPDQGPD